MIKLKYPLKYVSIEDYYNKGIHNGLDLIWTTALSNIEPVVFAPYDGEVIAVKKDYNQTDSSGRSYGNYVKIKHNDEISTLVAHLKYNSVKLNVGDKVLQGDYLGIMGNTGYSMGDHVHYEVFINNEKTDPLALTYVYEDQEVTPNENRKKGLLYYVKEEQKDKDTEDTIIKELETKINELTIENELLKKQNNNKIEYLIKEDAYYKIKLLKDETLIVR